MEEKNYYLTESGYFTLTYDPKDYLEDEVQIFEMLESYLSVSNNIEGILILMEEHQKEFKFEFKFWIKFSTNDEEKYEDEFEESDLRLGKIEDHWFELAQSYKLDMDVEFNLEKLEKSEKNLIFSLIEEEYGAQDHNNLEIKSSFVRYYNKGFEDDES